MILTADIGGTKTILAAATADSGRIELSSIQKYDSAQYSSFETILNAYLKDNPSLRLTSLCIAVAGPVIDNRCTVTNLKMVVDGRELARRDNFERVILINDLAAAGYGLEVMPDSAVTMIHAGAGQVDGNRVLISPGTGLGEAIIHYVDGRYVPLASEGGHADFAPFNGTTERLWAFLKRTRSRVAVEDVLSGPGIFNIYQFMISENGVEPDETFKRELASEPAKKISAGAVEGTDISSIQTIRLFLDIWAAEAGNMALKVLPVGGIYLGGGIIPFLLPMLDQGRFASILADKGGHRPLLEKFTVCAVTDTRLPLYGAANYILAASGD